MKTVIDKFKTDKDKEKIKFNMTQREEDKLIYDILEKGSDEDDKERRRFEREERRRKKNIIKV